MLTRIPCVTTYGSYWEDRKFVKDERDAELIGVVCGNHGYAGIIVLEDGSVVATELPYIRIKKESE